MNDNISRHIIGIFNTQMRFFSGICNFIPNTVLIIGSIHCILEMRDLMGNC